MTSAGELSPEQLAREFRTLIKPRIAPMVKGIGNALPEGWGVIFVVLPETAPPGDVDDYLAFGSTVQRERAREGFERIAHSLAHPDCPPPDGKLDTPDTPPAPEPDARQE